MSSGSGDEPAADPNAKAPWLEAAKEEREALGGAAGRAAARVEDTALRASSGSSEVARKVRADAEAGMSDAASKKKLEEEEKRLAEAVRGERGLDTLQRRQEDEIGKELGVALPNAAAPPAEHSLGATTKDTNYRC